MAGLQERYFGGPYASAFQDATNASTKMAREDFQVDQGKAIGGLAKIGGLRSGRAKTALNDMSRTFGRQVGNIAASNAGQLAQLEANRAEGEANRGVDRERISSSDRQASARLELDRTSGDRDFVYKQGRDTVGDTRYGEETSYSRSRDARADRREDDQTTYTRGRDAVGDARYTEETGYARKRDAVGDTRYAEETGYRKERDARGDMVTDRAFGYGKERDARGDFVTDRSFGEDQRKDARDFGRDTFESDRNFNEDKRRREQERVDAQSAAKKARKSSIWGTVGKIGGMALGSVLGPAGSAIGAKLGSAVASRIGGR